MRAAAIDLKSVIIYNDFLIKIGKLFRGGQFNNFWESFFLAEVPNIGLISCDECESSAISMDEARTFLLSPKGDNFEPVSHPPVVDEDMFINME
jgi:hypothetical protein